jgi:thioredoxin-dependent peroxiredoxin
MEMRKEGSMKFIIIAVVVMVLGGVIARKSMAKPGENSPVVGTAAPDFTLNSQEGTPVSLHDFKGKWVVLYFYPKDFTHGCTIEAHNFQRDSAQYAAKNAVILGVSMQDEKSHQEFCTKEGLSFKLLADTKNEVSEKYDSVKDLGVAKMSARHTFLIDPQGILRKSWLDVEVNKHSEEVLAALDEFQAKSSK